MLKDWCFAEILIKDVKRSGRRPFVREKGLFQLFVTKSLRQRERPFCDEGVS